jgi:hypothetical protein
MGNEIIQSVAYDNYDDFQHINIIFSQNFISLFVGLLNNETDHKVRYMILCEPATKGYTLSCHKQFEGRKREP